ncbi:hypothetical protein K7432_010856 [Basidiobolus ranarum]|uniref:Uncharacterized protein n=1 Tax=Basidiobolus ranarum TaxID=34480 RepID=A0ABR2WN71_9FUNG
MEPPLKIIAVKSSIAGIGWKPRYVPQLIVANVHTLVSHAFAFLKYIFTHELEHNSAFLLEDFINVGFFKEVFLPPLNNYKPDKQKASTESKAYKDLILQYRDKYFQCCSYEPVNMKYAHLITSYEVAKIVTTYLNGVNLQCGNKVRMFLNLFLKKNERIKVLESKMKNNGRSEKEIRAAIKTITEHIKKVKLVISSRNIEDIPKTSLSSNDLDRIHSLFGLYLTDYRFSKDSIYYDCKSNPLKYVKV